MKKSTLTVVSLCLLSALTWTTPAVAYTIEYGSATPQGTGCDAYSPGVMNFSIADPDFIPGTWGCEGLSLDFRFVMEPGDIADPYAVFEFEYEWDVSESGLGMEFAECDFEFRACGVTETAGVYVTEPGAGSGTAHIVCEVDYGVWYTLRFLTLFTDAAYILEYDITGLPLPAACYGTFVSDWVTVVLSSEPVNSDTRTWSQVKALYR